MHSGRQQKAQKLLDLPSPSLCHCRHLEVNKQMQSLIVTLHLKQMKISIYEVSIHQEDIAILNAYAPSNRTAK